MSAAPIRHPLLDAVGVDHGFGVRGARYPDGLLRAKQVHGVDVTSAAQCVGATPEADAIVSREPGVGVAVATADCVPILLSDASGTTVAAIHAGWRGLAAGVVAQTVDAARVDAARASAAPGANRWIAVVGPHIGPCCYEVDAPVIDAMTARFGGAADDAMRNARRGHVWLDLGLLARRALLDRGLADADVGALADACTKCDTGRFHSYRRDGERSGRLLHFIAARAQGPGVQG